MIRRLLSRLFPVAVLVAGMLFASSEAGAFQTFNVNGSSFSFPDVDDVDWGQDVTDWASAVSQVVTAISRSTSTSVLIGGNTNYAVKFDVATSTSRLMLVGGNSNYALWNDVVVSTNRLALTGENSNYFKLDASTQSGLGSLDIVNLIIRGRGWINTLSVSSLSATTILVATNGIVGGGSTFTAVSMQQIGNNNIWWTMPTADGSSGDFLKTNGSRVLSFGASAAGGSSSGRSYLVTVGTWSGRNPDVISLTQEGLIAAISSVSASPGGGTVFIQPGLYISTYCVGVPSNVTIIADDGAIFQNANASVQRAFVIKGRWKGGWMKPTHLTTNTTTFILLDGEYADLDGITIKETTSTTNASWAWIGFTGNNPTARNCRFINNTMAGSGAGCRIFTSLDPNTKGLRIINNEMSRNSGNGLGWAVIDSTNPYIVSGNRVTDNKWTMIGGLFLFRSSYSMITGNLFDSQQEAAANTPIYAQYQGDQGSIFATIIANNTFIGGTTPILLESGAGVSYGVGNLISGNTFIRPTTAAIKQSRSTSGTNVGNFIHGNVVWDGTFVSEDASVVNCHHRDNVLNTTLQTDD